MILLLSIKWRGPEYSHTLEVSTVRYHHLLYPVNLSARQVVITGIAGSSSSRPSGDSCGYTAYINPYLLASRAFR